MKIALTSVMVDDQDRALAFYTGRLGFSKKHDIPLGQFRWLTVVSPEAPDGVELVLEPNAHPAGQAFQKAMFAEGIPVATFAVADVYGEFERLRGEGVVFRKEPAPMGPVTIAVLDDTCGNCVQLLQTR